MRLELVKDWMTREPITVGPDVTVLDAGRLMVDRTIRRLPVLEQDELVGIVTYGDVRGARAAAVAGTDIWELGNSLARLTIREIMTPNPVTITPVSYTHLDVYKRQTQNHPKELECVETASC